MITQMPLQSCYLNTLDSPPHVCDPHFWVLLLMREGWWSIWNSSKSPSSSALISMVTSNCTSLKSRLFLKFGRVAVKSKKRHKQTYSLSHKTVNARENFWNVYCFATNQMRNETAKDYRQTAVGMNHDLIQRAGFSSTRNLQFPLDPSEKAIFWPQASTSHLIPSVQKPIYRIDLNVSANCENLRRYRSASWVKVSQLQKKYGSKTTNHS